MKTELLKCETLLEMIAIINLSYDLEAPLNAVQKQSAASFLSMAPLILNLEKK